MAHPSSSPTTTGWFPGLPIPIRLLIVSYLDDGSQSAMAVAIPAFRGLKRMMPRGPWCCPSWRFLDGMTLSSTKGGGGGRPFRWGCWDDHDRDLIHWAIDRYDRFLCHQVQPSLPPTIPCIIHHIWLGGHPPESVRQLRQTWIDKHKDWTHKLWGDEEAQEFVPNMVNAKAFREAPNLGQKSDILRYEILLQQGGVYIDADMECVEPLDDLHYHHHLSFYTGFSNTGTVELNNGLIGAKARHPILECLVERINKQQGQDKAGGGGGLPPSLLAMMAGSSALAGFLGDTEISNTRLAVKKAEEENRAMSTIEKTGPGLFTRVVMDYLRRHQKQPIGTKDAEEGLLLAPSSWFYPVPNNVNGLMVDDLEASHSVIAPYLLPGITRAVHYWARSWQNKGTPLG